MIEYPSIEGPAKAPRMPCIAFEKLDGSNIRVKYTRKEGFTIFGSRREYIDEKHPHLGQVIEVFNKTHAEPLTKLFKSESKYNNEQELIVFGEFFGVNSFAGLHNRDDIKQFVLFDVYLPKRKLFIPPKEFVKTFADIVATPRVVYEGNLNDEFIAAVKRGDYSCCAADEGVVCKGLQSNGAYRGKVWMCKIKTDAYIQRLVQRYGEAWKEYV